MPNHCRESTRETRLTQNFLEKDVVGGGVGWWLNDIGRICSANKLQISLYSPGGSFHAGRTCMYH